jgi:hypothetical protein
MGSLVTHSHTGFPPPKQGATLRAQHGVTCLCTCSLPQTCGAAFLAVAHSFNAYRLPGVLDHTGSKDASVVSNASTQAVRDTCARDGCVQTTAWIRAACCSGSAAGLCNLQVPLAGHAFLSHLRGAAAKTLSVSQNVRLPAISLLVHFFRMLLQPTSTFQLRC